jgi:hypothetical protein
MPGSNGKQDIQHMTRFKKLRRIEAAIQNGNKDELNWAIQYCRMRLKIVTMKTHEKHWQKLIQKLKTTLEKIEEEIHQEK